MHSPISLLALTGLLSLAFAKTDYEGCTSYTSIVQNTRPGYSYATVIYYDPTNLEICHYVDCGGGRAPPKTVPGCPAYSGTDTVTPSFLESDPLKTEVAASTTATDTTFATAATTTAADGSDDGAETGAAEAGSGTTGAAAQETGATETDDGAEEATETGDEAVQESGGADFDVSAAGRVGFEFALPAVLGLVVAAIIA